jgi:isocitrate dehydrogenase kinase/phosphatase
MQSIFALLHDSHLYHLNGPLDTNIHHVEHWGPLVNNYLAAQVGSYSRDVFTKEIEAKIAQGIDFEELKKTEYYQDILTYGKNCQKNYVDFKWVSVLHVPIL